MLEPAPGVLAFYEGRVEGYRFDPEPNWVDEGALSLVPLRELIADSLAAGSAIYFARYEAVHRQNVTTVLAAGS